METRKEYIDKVVKLLKKGIPTVKVLKQRIYANRYYHSPNGNKKVRACIKRYAESGKASINSKKYRCSEHGQKIRKDYYSNNREKLLQCGRNFLNSDFGKEYHRNYQKDIVGNLKDTYIISMLKKRNTNVTIESIKSQPHLIEMKRSQIKLHREIIKNNNN